MNRGSRNRNIVTTCLVVVTVVLAVVAAGGTANYYQFYPALARLQVDVSSLQWTVVNDTNSNPVIETNVSLKIQNPTAFKGLGVKEVEGTWGIESVTGNFTVPQGGLPFTTLVGPLDPGNVTTVKFAGFNATNSVRILLSQPKIAFVFNVKFLFSTFLDKRGSVAIFYSCSAIGPSTCDQDLVTIITPGVPSAGGGGGGGR